MADQTKIEWTDATWNIVTGCSVVSPGCTNCYAMRLAGTRLKHHPSRKGLTRDTRAGPVWTGEVRFNAQWLEQPLRWKKPRMIFVAAHGDLFADGVTDNQLDQIFAVMAFCSWHIFQVLTKRPERMREYLLGRRARAGRTLPNAWLGVSVEDEPRAEERIPVLLETPASLHWVSNEPSLGPINWKRWLPAGRRARRPGGEEFIAPHFYMTKCEHCGWAGSSELCGVDSWGDDSDVYCPNCQRSILADELEKIGWIVAGGENGPRSMHPDWARAARDQAAIADVPFLFKQWGSWKPSTPAEADANPRSGWLSIKGRVDRAVKASELYPEAGAAFVEHVGKKAAGRLLDGVEHNGFPPLPAHFKEHADDQKAS